MPVIVPLSRCVSTVSEASEVALVRACGVPGVHHLTRRTDIGAIVALYSTQCGQHAGLLQDDGIVDVEVPVLGTQCCRGLPRSRPTRA